MLNKVRRGLALLMSVLLLLASVPAGAATAIKCPHCGSAKYESGYEEWWDRVTCTEPGRVEVGNCGECDFLNMKDVAPLGHDWTEWYYTGATSQLEMPKKATCTQPGGEQWRYCQRCKVSEQRTEPALGHNWGNWITLQPSTCQVQGTGQCTCLRCGQQQWFTLPLADHQWGEWQVVVEPKPCAKGYEERTCGVCGIAEQRPIYPEGTLFKGDRGEAVKALQEALNEAGYNCGNADGIFGSNTEKAIKAFQEDQGMDPDGVGYPCLPGRLSGEKDPDEYTSALLLELIDAPETFYGRAGDQIELHYRLTNTGDTALDVQLSHVKMDDADGVNVSDAVDSMSLGWSHWFKPGDYFEPLLRYTVREEDMARGEIVLTYQRIGTIWCDDNLRPVDPEAEESGENDHLALIEAYIRNEYVYCNEVTVRIPVVELDYSGSMQLELAAPLGYFGGDAGDTIEALFRLTNIGDTTLCATDYDLWDGADTLVDYFHNFGDGDWVIIEPDQSIEFTVPFAVTEADMALGRIVRKITHYGDIWVGANGVPMGWEGSEYPAIHSHGELVECNTVTVTVPLAGLDFSGSMQLEVVSAPGYFSYGVGYGTEVIYRLTNIGDTHLCATSYELRDGNGHIVRNFSNSGWGDWVDIAPGDSIEFTVPFEATEWDMECGAIVRELTHFGDIWVGQNGIPMDWEGGENPYSHGYGERVTCNTVTVTIPLSDEPTPWWFEGVTLTKSVSGNTPFAYGTPARLGDTIQYMLTVTNDTDQTMYDVEIYDPIKGNNEDAVVTMGDILAPGESQTYDFSYTVTAKDVLTGEIVNTASMRWCFEDDPSTQETISNTVVVPTVGKAAESSQLTLEKELVNMPANGEYFVPGEMALFTITARNETGKAMFNVEIADSLHNAEGVLENTLFVFNVMEAGVERNFNFPYIITEADAWQGFVENEAIVFGYDASGEMYGDWCELVYAPCGLTGGEVSYHPEVYIDKKETSAPANGEYYELGETITYEITVENTGDVGVGMCTVVDMLLNPKNNYYYGVTELDAFMQLYVGERRSFTFSHVVDETNVADGAVKNGAEISYECDGEEYSATSNFVQSPVGGSLNVSAYPGLAFTKSVTGAPANGMHYVPGEVVHFAIYLNNEYQVLTDVVVKDALAATPLATLASVGYGDKPSWTFDYTVTEWDALNGSVTNVATLTAYDEDGNDVIVSDAEIVPTGLDAGFGVITDISITKTETSTPANGSYYTEGETITYTITIRNEGETNLGECIIYDSLAPSDIGSAEHLYVGEARQVFLNHTVTAADVAAGCVYNTAWVMVYDDYGYTSTEMSNTVVSDTDGVAETPTPGTPGVIVPTLPEGTVPCSREQLAKGDNGEAHMLHYCEVHVKVQQTVTELVNKASTEDERQAAWTQAVDMWRAEIDAMYTTLMNDADPIAKINIMDERIRFYAAVGCHEALLNELYPDDPTRVASMMADLMMDKSVNLCYAMNTAPKDRVDAFDHVSGFGFKLPCGEDCIQNVIALPNGDVQYTELLCAHHAAILQMRNRLLASNGNAEEAWTTVGQLWKIEVNTAYNGLYITLDEAQQALVLADYKAFENSVAAHEKVLLALYDRPEVVKEVIAQTMMERATEICGLR